MGGGSALGLLRLFLGLLLRALALGRDDRDRLLDGLRLLDRRGGLRLQLLDRGVRTRVLERLVDLGLVDPERAQLALRIALSQAIKEATPDVVQGFSSADDWAERLERLCEGSMGSLLGGSWSARALSRQLSPSELAPEQSAEEGLSA